MKVFIATILFIATAAAAAISPDAVSGAFYRVNSCQQDIAIAIYGNPGKSSNVKQVLFIPEISRLESPTFLTSVPTLARRVRTNVTFEVDSTMESFTGTMG
jgi:hypothetical protein